MNKETLKYGAIIVGARVVGAATAMLMARSGMKVLVVDRQQCGSDTLSTHALMRGAVVQLSRWGILTKSSHPTHLLFTKLSSIMPATR